MCDSLIADHQYGLDAIGTILAVAQKYGEPISVLKMIETFGNLKALEAQAIEIEGTIAEREKLLASLEAQFKEAQEKLDGIYAKALSIGDKIGRVEGKYEASEDLRRIFDILKSPENADYGGHGPTVLLLAASLHKWVIANQDKFKWPDNIKTGLKYLVEELGGMA